MALIGEISDNSTNRTRRDGLTIESGSRHEAFAMNETMVETEVTYTLAHEGKFYIIEHVPARVCQETGEQLFAPDTVEHIQAIIQGKTKPVA